MRNVEILVENCMKVQTNRALNFQKWNPRILLTISFFFFHKKVRNVEILVENCMKVPTYRALNFQKWNRILPTISFFFLQKSAKCKILVQNCTNAREAFQKWNPQYLLTIRSSLKFLRFHGDYKNSSFSHYEPLRGLRKLRMGFYLDYEKKKTGLQRIPKKTQKLAV